MLLDEATASISMDADRSLQRILSSNHLFTNTTIISIAHRLNTVMDSDVILVMEDGKVAEIGTPKTLLEDPQSFLGALIKKTGPDSERHLTELALGQGQAT